MAEAVLIDIGKGLAVEGAKALAGLILSRASEEASRAGGFRDKLDNLQTKLVYVTAFLEDLGLSNYQGRQMALLDMWLKRFQDVAYLTDNLMDEYAYEIIRRKLKLKYSVYGITKFRYNIVRTPLLFRFRMSLKVNHILSLFDELDKEAKAIGLNQVEIVRDAQRGPYNGAGNSSDMSWNDAREHTAGGGDTNMFVGRKDDERELLKQLCDSHKDNTSLPIIAVVGMGGLGKTTLVKRIYGHQNVNALFRDNKIWICVTQNFNIARLLNETVEAVTLHKGDLSNKDAIIRKLRDLLGGKKFLLVLDDVWMEDQKLWESLQESLKEIGGLPGSVIMITTRSKNVADAARVVYKQKLKGLCEDDSLDLLKQNVVIDDEDSCRKELGKRIAKKCKGVPLAINVIGRLMSKQNSQHEWEAIDRSELWELPEGEKEILPSLLLSFNHLPSPSLKQCFAYCAIFPKAYRIDKDVVIAHWIAQGYLHIPSSETRRSTLEDIGDKHFSTLLNNLLLQEDDENDDGVIWYKMHDLVHDIAVYLSKDLLMIREANDQQKVDDYRHLVFRSEQDHMVCEFSDPVTLRKLRTIVFKGICAH